MAKSDIASEVGMHVFERAGLGKAPFRFVGFFEKKFQPHPDAPVQAGGSCDYCGTAIVGCYQVRSACGRTFKVGCDCIEKTGDRGLIQAYKKSPEYRAKQADARKRADARVIAEWNALIAAPEVVAKLSAMFVPGRPWVPGETISLLESITRLWSMCGATGRARTLRSLKHHLSA